MTTSKDRIDLFGIPIPPSVNNAYFNVIGRGRVKTDAYRAYERQFAQWAMTHFQEIQTARHLIKDMLGPGRALHIRRVYHFQKSRIIQASDSKKVKDPKNFRRAGEPKTNDTTNRVKILDDCLAQVLYIDDCWFWSDENKKLIAHPVQPERVDVSLFPIEIC